MKGSKDFTNRLKRLASGSRRKLTLAAGAAAMLTAAILPLAPAMADNSWQHGNNGYHGGWNGNGHGNWNGGWNNGYHGGYYNQGYGHGGGWYGGNSFGFSIYSAPAYYYAPPPPPVYYQPAPVYYAPPPAYYAPPAFGFGLNLNFH